MSRNYCGIQVRSQGAPASPYILGPDYHGSQVRGLLPPPPPPFKGYHGVTPGYTLSPTTYQMVVEAVIRHWVTVVEATEVEAEGLGMSTQELAAYFYIDKLTRCINLARESAEGA